MSFDHKPASHPLQIGHDNRSAYYKAYFDSGKTEHVTKKNKAKWKSMKIPTIVIKYKYNSLLLKVMSIASF